jgi:hypothetical protein
MVQVKSQPSNGALPGNPFVRERAHLTLDAQPPAPSAVTVAGLEPLTAGELDGRSRTRDAARPPHARRRHAGLMQGSDSQ